MTQHFPCYTDVPLMRAPLGEVICHVRFSPIFRIESDLPSDLQESIREWFPEAHFTTDGDPHLYQFLSRDAGWAFWLGPEAFTLSTRRYTAWDEFGRYLAVVQNAMQKVYRIPSYKGISLRYLNVFAQDNTGYETLPEICEVLRPELVLPLQTPELADASELATSLLLDESGGKLAMRVAAKSAPDEGGPALVLDLDFHVDGSLPTDGLVERCKKYHDTIYNAFRWSLNADKLDLFGPITEGVAE